MILNPSALKLAFGNSKKVSSKSDRKKALEADVIVTTSGMLEGGPAIWYLNRLRMDRRNSVFITDKLKEVEVECYWKKVDYLFMVI